MKVYTDKQGISHEETFEFDKKSKRDMRIKKWFDSGLNKPITSKKLFKTVTINEKTIPVNKVGTTIQIIKGKPIVK